jgi:hypothetical protein
VLIEITEYDRARRLGSRTRMPSVDVSSDQDPRMIFGEHGVDRGPVSPRTRK